MHKYLMQKIFKIWLIFIFILALIASLIVDIESLFFGFLLLPLLIITAALIIFGYVRK